jgi:hypothetical protein
MKQSINIRCMQHFLYFESHAKSLQSTEISLYLAFTNELNVAQKEKKYWWMIDFN